MVSQENVMQLLARVIEPELKWSITSLNLVKKIDIEQSNITLDINLITKKIHEIENVKLEVKQLLEEVGFQKITVNIGRVNVPDSGIAGVKKIILVGSGKGGVGKSFVAVNLAAELSQQGFKVGLLDADIYGPSVDILLGISDKPEVLSAEYLLPVTSNGIKAISIGCLVSADKFIDWRGQMTSATILQFLQKTLWGDIDYLIVDLPPGTGDITLTIAHKVKCDGVVLVSTPHKLSVADVTRAVNLFTDRDIPLLGLAINMASFQCSNCSHEEELFPGSLNCLPNIPILAKLPFAKVVNQAADSGMPLVKFAPDSVCAKAFTKMAQTIDSSIATNEESGDEVISCTT